MAGGWSRGRVSGAVGGVGAPRESDRPADLSPSGRWDSIERRFDLILEELEALRPDLPSWSLHAHFEQMARVERTASKLRTFRRVATGMEGDG